MLKFFTGVAVGVILVGLAVEGMARYNSNTEPTAEAKVEAKGPVRYKLVCLGTDDVQEFIASHYNAMSVRQAPGLSFSMTSYGTTVIEDGVVVAAFSVAVHCVANKI